MEKEHIEVNDILSSTVKVETINQYKLMQHVKDSFNPEANITVKLIDNNTIMIKDLKGEYCYLEMKIDGTIKEEFHMGERYNQEQFTENSMDYEMEP